MPKSKISEAVELKNYKVYDLRGPNPYKVKVVKPNSKKKKDERKSVQSKYCFFNYFHGFNF